MESGTRQNLIFLSRCGCRGAGGERLPRILCPGYGRSDSFDVTERELPGPLKAGAAAMKAWSRRGPCRCGIARLWRWYQYPSPHELVVLHAAALAGTGWTVSS